MQNLHITELTISSRVVVADTAGILSACPWRMARLSLIGWCYIHECLPILVLAELWRCYH